ncbi:copper resistance CopC family protein [Ahrensia marina]|uniref:copper resistance CopC family protein n=1 Tax=Ahrensia marina TaxID=1514904 RepID=UPI0035CF6BDF
MMVRFLGSLLLASILGLGSALAHSTKEATVPEDGASLDAAPSEVMIQFDEPATLTRVELVHSNEGETQETRLMPPGEAMDMTHLDAPDLGPGLYTVEWRAMSADGHAVNGSFSFTVTGN